MEIKLENIAVKAKIMKVETEKVTLSRRGWSLERGKIEACETGKMEKIINAFPGLNLHNTST